MTQNVHKILDKVRNHLISYCAFQNPLYKAPDHLRIIAKALQDIEEGIIKRLIITVPPRHGKSMLTSQYFPAWYMGRNPDKYIITSTYGQDLANDFGSKVRDQLADPLFQQIFPQAVLKKDSTAKHRFGLAKGGEFYGAGVGGPIVGRGAHLLLIDDPLKNREEADSPIIRSKVNRWYTGTAYHRLMPGAAIAVIMTRWHEEDLVGYLLSEHSHENWTVINLPALSDDNIALWPEQYTVKDLNRIKTTMEASGSLYDWYCLYQQDPIPEEGSLVEESWIKRGLSDNGYCGTYMAIDPAISKKDSADETAFTVFGVGYGPNPSFYELETVHGKFSFQEQIDMGKMLYEKHNIDMFGVESVAFQKALADEFTRQGLPCFELKADQDKVRRFMSVSHFFSQGRVYINTPAAKEQLIRFRGVDGDKDDIVDAIVHCLRLMRDHARVTSKKSNDRYAHLDGRSKMFWQNHYKELPWNQGSSDDINKIIGF